MRRLPQVSMFEDIVLIYLQVVSIILRQTQTGNIFFLS